jgi:hypothetical protein
MPMLGVLPGPLRHRHREVPRETIQIRGADYFIIAAVITPSADVVTQVIFAAPMLVLYI